jgi:hypothetical protein
MILLYTLAFPNSTTGCSEKIYSSESFGEYEWQKNSLSFLCGPRRIFISMASIGENIRKLRKARGLTQEQLAE